MKKNILFILLAIAIASCSKKDSTPDTNLNQNIVGGTPIGTGSFTGTPGHTVSGSATWVTTNGETKLQLSNFSTSNGPDLRVYVSKDLNASSFISLGKLQSTSGNQVYTIPSGTDVKNFPYALIWCQQFSVLFGSALVK